jgi:hypothetical protein
MKVIQSCESPQTILPEGLIYVGQDCYYLASRDAGSPQYLYSDSATSCVILILEGAGHDECLLIALTHLSCYERFRAFFDLVDRHFSGPLSVFAVGANPPSAELSQYNSRIVLHWILTHTPSQAGRSIANTNWYIEPVSLALDLRVSEKARSGCAGIDVRTGIVSTQAYVLADAQRDPTGGVQTLFSIFGLQTDPPMLLHNSAEPFCEDEITRLVEQAERAHWTAILEMTDGQILTNYSSTPDDEVPWFCEGLRASARYVKKYIKRDC